MALISSQQASLAGTAITYGAASVSDTVALRKGGVYIVKNGAVAPVTFTRVVPGNDDNAQARGDIAATVTNGTEKWFYLNESMVDPDTGLITVQLSSAATITVAYVVV